MGITIYSMPQNLQRRLKHLKKRHSIHKYNYKKYKKPISIDIVSVFEDELYNLNTSSLHLKLYIKKLMYEYTGDTRAEIAVFYAMAVNLYKEVSDAYYGIMNYKRNILDIDINDMKDKYEGILDLCGISEGEVYDALFDENDDGYETPPREGEERPDSLCEEMCDDEEGPDDVTKEDDDELYAFAIECINKKLSIK
jgi:hypothetical protein